MTKPTCLCLVLSALAGCGTTTTTTTRTTVTPVGQFIDDIDRACRNITAENRRNPPKTPADAQHSMERYLEGLESLEAAPPLDTAFAEYKRLIGLQIQRIAAGRYVAA